MGFRALFDDLTSRFDPLRGQDGPVLTRRPKVADVAARAGVSTATVDRVINGRGGAHQKTVALVEAAIRDIVDGQRVERAAVPATQRFDVLLAGDGTRVTQALGEALVAAGAVVPAHAA